MVLARAATATGARLWIVALGVRKNVSTVARYPLGIINMSILNPLHRLILPSILLGSAFLVGGRAVGLQHSAGTTSYRAFLFLGAAMNVLTVGAIIGTAAVFTAERETGTLEQCWTTPARRILLGAQMAVSALVISAIGSVSCLVLGLVLFGVRLRWATLAALPSVLLAIVGLIGVSYLVMALLLRVRQARAVMEGAGFALGMLAGNIFPVTVLPDPLLALARLLPMTYAVDLLRHHAIGARPLMAPGWEYLVQAACTVVMLAVGLLAYTAVEHRIRATGEIGQY